MAQKICTQWNPNCNAKESRTLLNYVTRFNHVVGGGNLVDFQACFNAWLMPAASTGPLDDLGNDFTIVKMSLEHNGVIYPVTFNGGSRTVNIINGVNDKRCDTVTVATAWSKPYLVIDDEFQVKLEILLPTTAAAMHFSPRSTTDATGNQCWFYDGTATTLVNDTDSPGPYTSTGAAPQLRSTGYSPWFVGNYTTADTVALVAEGDSITAGTGDNQQNKSGRAWLQRMVGLMSAKPSCLNLAIHGSNAQAGTTDPRILYWYPFCTHGWIFKGTNDFATNGLNITVATMMTRIALLTSRMQSGGITKIGYCCLMVRTNSTDSYATEANQTVFSGWEEVGSRPRQYNDLLKSTYQYVVAMDSVRGIDKAKWLTNGTPFWYAFDTTHPAYMGYIAMANEALVIMNAMLSSSGPSIKSKSTFIGLGLGI